MKTLCGGQVVQNFANSEISLCIAKISLCIEKISICIAKISLVLRKFRYDCEISLLLQIAHDLHSASKFHLINCKN